MTKAQIHFSNDLSTLIEILKRQLFREGSGPFEKRLIAVPHMALKDEIMLAFASDPDLQVAAGMEIVNVNQAYTKISGKVIPSKMELSLFLQHELIPMIEVEPELRSYFAESVKEERIGPFCDKLAGYFLRYAKYGKPSLSLWQEKLFEKLPWVFPQDFKGKKGKWQIHLLGFTAMPKSYFEFFKARDAHFYLFSPCEIYFGDFYSEKEQAFFRKEVPENQLDLFSASFEDQNRLLSNLGKVGRQMQILSEESDIPTREYYLESEKGTALSTLQNAILHGSSEKAFADESIQIVSASSRLREVEILKDQLLNLFETKEIKPKDVQVFAPDINEYAPYIEAVFEELTFTMSDVDFAKVDRTMGAFLKLLELPKNRFSVDEVIQLLSSMKFSFDLSQVGQWVRAADIRWGFSKKQREQLYLQDLSKEEIFGNTSRGTWEEGFRRLILGIGQIEGEAIPAISQTQLEEFDRLYTVLNHLSDDLAPLFDGTKMTISTWLRYLACVLESYFAIDPGHDLYKELLQLSASSDHLDREEIPYEGIKRVLTKGGAKRFLLPTCKRSVLPL